VDEDMSIVDLPESATTSGAKLVERMARSAGREASSMTVVFSTYQSLQAVHEAQAEHGLPDFDLIVCDEAHRTTGVTLAGEDESSFVRVHDPAYVRAAKRLYMTATPRLYAPKADGGDTVVVVADDLGGWHRQRWPGTTWRTCRTFRRLGWTRATTRAIDPGGSAAQPKTCLQGDVAERPSRCPAALICSISPLARCTVVTKPATSRRRATSI
jgi:hypothetical protein